MPDVPGYDLATGKPVYDSMTGKPSRCKAICPPLASLCTDVIVTITGGTPNRDTAAGVWDVPLQDLGGGLYQYYYVQNTESETDPTADPPYVEITITCNITHWEMSIGTASEDGPIFSVFFGDLGSSGPVDGTWTYHSELSTGVGTEPSVSTTKTGCP